MSPLKITPGDVHGLLIAIRPAPSDQHQHRMWVFRCACGAETVRAVASVIRAAERGIQCGCRRCQFVRHAQYMRESGNGLRSISRTQGMRRAVAIVEPVDIDRDLPDVFG